MPRPLGYERRDAKKLGARRFAVVDLTNRVALYNSLSTFSATHSVPPRTETLGLDFHF
jgi:hypothetical protein